MSKLSVIIPGYNTRREWWVRCVRSVSAAVVKACGEEGEILCVDDGSKVPVEQGWFDGIPGTRVIRLEKNSGLPTARNAGLKEAQGEFVTFVDSDDEVREQSYLRCIEALEKYQADVAVYGVNGIFPSEGFQVHDVPEGKFYGPLMPCDVAYLVKRRLFYYSWNKVFRMSFFREHNLWFYPEGVPCEDAIFNVGLVEQKASWVTVAYEGYVYYRYDGSLLSSYKPTLVAGLNACSAAWKRYKTATPGAYEAIGKYDERSPETVVREQWTNIWRRNSPFSLRERWRYAAENANVLGARTAWVVMKKAVFMWARAHFYFRPIRDWHYKRFLKRIGAVVVKWEKP